MSFSLRSFSLRSFEGTGVEASFLASSGALPLVLAPAAVGMQLVSWTGDHRALLDDALDACGAVLFRGFHGEEALGAERFERIAESLCSPLLASNPEHVTVTGRVQTPVAYSAKHKLLWHNENSFNRVWPRKLLFACEEPADAGGETPLVDSRRMFRELRPDIRDTWLHRGVMYVRNFGSALGLPWQQVFGTNDRAEVERRCADDQVDFTWMPGDLLRTRAVRPAAIPHPRTGEWCWFNQMQHWHVASLGAETRASLASIMPEEEFPRGCTFGDGSPIPEEHVHHILALYAALEASFAWRRGDVLLVDNVLAAHARNPYTGQRRLLVGLGEPTPYSDASVMDEMEVGAL
ncbi:TauD/TfdA family dioxygenase [Chondromyces apiculatus]|uniref:SyrP-like protein n=1 Tax=Chondromyces apiculatus DSM 436 TaxID=1192034 RepID=A0A017SWD6_9BACT|nr:TauD/TfdA family dioxygenase [Chondromyces apiculatus]EYF01037.1 SyrP-like protein [Chondromyces apiculatus DSM 436]